MFLPSKKLPWCQHRRLWKIPCFLSKLLLFSSCDARTDVCGAIPAPAKNPYTVGIWGLFWPAWCRSLTCNHFSHLKLLKIYHISWCSGFHFFVVFLPSWGNSSTPEGKRRTGAYKGTQGHLFPLMAPATHFPWIPLKRKDHLLFYAVVLKWEINILIFLHEIQSPIIFPYIFYVLLP